MQITRLSMRNVYTISSSKSLVAWFVFAFFFWFVCFFVCLFVCFFFLGESCDYFRRSTSFLPRRCQDQKRRRACFNVFFFLFIRSKIEKKWIFLFHWRKNGGFPASFLHRQQNKTKKRKRKPKRASLHQRRVQGRSTAEIRLATAADQSEAAKLPSLMMRCLLDQHKFSSRSHCWLPGFFLLAFPANFDRKLFPLVLFGDQSGTASHKQMFRRRETVAIGP